MTYTYVNFPGQPECPLEGGTPLMIKALEELSSNAQQSSEYVASLPLKQTTVAVFFAKNNRIEAALQSNGNSSGTSTSARTDFSRHYGGLPTDLGYLPLREGSTIQTGGGSASLEVDYVLRAGSTIVPIYSKRTSRSDTSGQITLTTGKYRLYPKEGVLIFSIQSGVGANSNVYGVDLATNRTLFEYEVPGAWNSSESAVSLPCLHGATSFFAFGQSTSPCGLLPRFNQELSALDSYFYRLPTWYHDATIIENYTGSSFSGDYTFVPFEEAQGTGPELPEIVFSRGVASSICYYYYDPIANEHKIYVTGTDASELLQQNPLDTDVTVIRPY
jgi:hypothetical protein